MSEICTRPVCVPNAQVRHHPKWGYDLDALPLIRCLSCGELIGGEEYIEVTIWARFGQIMFRHVRCEQALTNKD